MSDLGRGLCSSFRAALRGARIFCFVLLMDTNLPASQAVAQEVPLRGVPYITNRNILDATGPSRIYGEERGEFDAGFCQVIERRFDILSSVSEATPFNIPDELLRVAQISPRPVNEVLSDLVATSGGLSPLLYTHGFNIDFEKGCRRATMLKENTGLSDRFLWFSWPSDGNLFNYTHDEADLYWSVFDLSYLILTLHAEFQPTPINLAGHSLGARGMMLAIYDVLALRPDIQLGDVILMAPDIDFDIFERLLARVRPNLRSLTIYVAPGDRPLALSEQVHGHPRLGQAGNPVERLQGVEVIDLGDIPFRSATGHNYHIYNIEVWADLYQLLNEGLGATARRNLIQAGPNLWRLQPQG